MTTKCPNCGTTHEEFAVCEKCHPMMTPITPEYLAELERITNDATPGPWEAEDSGWGANLVRWAVNSSLYTAPLIYVYTNCEPDARFIATSRTALPALIAEVRKLREANDTLMQNALRILTREGHPADHKIESFDQFEAMGGAECPICQKQQIERLRCELAHAEADRNAALKLVEMREGERDALREVTTKLPTTADGVTVGPGMTVWSRFYNDIIEIPVKLEARGPNCDGRATEPYQINYCYSTKAAAEAAREGKS